MGKLDVDPALVRKLADLLEETGLSEIEYQSGGQRIRVRRQVGGVVAGMPIAAASVPASAEPAGPPPGAVLSPMVGTVYMSPEPDARPFVAIGERVAAGQTLVIIEAMKVMNPIIAAHSGTVAEILVRNGQPVEFGEVLMVVR